MSCVLIGIPIWFVTGVLVTFSPEFAKALGMAEPVSAGRAILCVSIGLALGDLSSGLLSQFIKSRKKTVGLFMTGMAALALVYLLVPGLGTKAFYGLCFALGICAGYWAVFVTVASEQFGTNLRATVTTTVPNFVRGSVVVINLAFTALLARHLPVVQSALIVGGVCFVLAFGGLLRLQETYGKDLNYTEQ